MNWLFNNTPFLLELGAVICGVLYVFFASRNNILCWPAGILGSIFSVLLFAFYSKLYSEAGLNLYYVIVGVLGWIEWNKPTEDAPIVKVPIWYHFVIVPAGVLGSLGFYYLISTFFTDADKPLLDATTTIFSFITTWLTIQKWLSSWIYWIVINAVTIFMYLSKDLYMYSSLVFVLMTMAFYGYYNWQRILKNQNA